MYQLSCLCSASTELPLQVAKKLTKAELAIQDEMQAMKKAEASATMKKMEASRAQAKLRAGNSK